MKWYIKKYLTVIRLVICNTTPFHSDLPTVFERDEEALLTVSISRCKHCNRVTFMGMKFDKTSEWRIYNKSVIDRRRIKIKQNKELAQVLTELVSASVDLYQARLNKRRETHGL